jgi:topoisomerase IA-like protein
MSFLGTIISPVASLVGGLASSFIGSEQNANAVKSTNATNLQIAQQNNAFNQQMWEENNAYNDPSAQRDRLLKAGINPYQGDNVASVASKSVEGTMPAPMQAPQPGNAFLQSSPYIANFATQMMNQQLMSAQVKTAEATAESSVAKAELDKATAQKMLGVDTESVHQDIQNKAYQGRLLSLQADSQLPSDKSMETITLEEALELFKLPRTVGQFENTDVVIGAGRFGPYIMHNKKYVSLPKTENPMTITLETAIQLINEKREQEKQRHIKSFEQDAAMEVLNGRYGPYIAYDGKNYRMPKALHEKAAELTFEQCMDIVKNAPEPKARRKK